jgi:hypothetical protein
MLRDAEANGEGLCGVEKGFFLGTGVTFRMFFRKERSPRHFRIVPLHGRLRDERDPIFDGRPVFSVLSMKALGITTGYFYFLEEGNAQPSDGVDAATPSGGDASDDE